MSEALQAETLEPQEAPEAIQFDDGVEETEVEEAPEPVEETAEKDEEDERVEFSPKQQEFLEKKIIARFVARQKAAEEQAQKLQQELAEIQSKAGTQKADVDEHGAPVIPDLPDVWDSQYEEKIKLRDERIAARVRWESEQQVAQYRQQQEQQKHLEALNKRTESYVSRGKDYGISQEDIQRSAATIESAGGIPMEVIDVILDDDAGPAITAHLARNPGDLDAIQQLPPYKAALYLATQVKPKAVRNAKRRIEPPEPISTEKGASGKEERGVPGVTYE